MNPEDALPDSNDAEKVQTSLVDGILTLTLPKAEWSKPRKIAINAASKSVTPKGVI